MTDETYIDREGIARVRPVQEDWPTRIHVSCGNCGRDVPTTKGDPHTTGYGTMIPATCPHCGSTTLRPNCNTSPVVPGELYASSGHGPAGHKGASVGRIVHYYRQAAMVPAAEREPMAAIITRVHEGSFGMVELQVFGLGTECPIHRTVPFHPSARSGCWTWPPRV